MGVEELERKVKAEVQRPDFGLRVIIIWKVIKGSLLLAVAVSAIVLRHHDLHEMAVDAVRWLGIDPAGPRMGKVLANLIGVSPMKIGIGAGVVAIVMFVEAWGLHRRRVWAEWMTVIVTSSLIPVEIYHLARHPSLGKVITLIANVAIVMYLLRHRWLFVPGRIGRWWKARRTGTSRPGSSP